MPLHVSLKIRLGVLGILEKVAAPAAPYGYGGMELVSSARIVVLRAGVRNSIELRGEFSPHWFLPKRQIFLTECQAFV